MPAATIEIDVHKPALDQPVKLHNRWHPAIPPLLEITPGSDCRLQCLDFTGGQIDRTDDPADVDGLKFESVHPLTGPIAVKGARPGDLLVVDILSLGSLESWGFSMVFPGQLRTGLLYDEFPDAAKSVWEIAGDVATSKHIPRVRLKAHMHPGLIGCAPDEKLLGEWNRREAELARRGPNQLSALPPEPMGALLGELPKAEWDHVAAEASRTTAHRENGGNADIKEFGVGARLYFPVRVDGGKLSAGDLHFSMGDGEITAAVEMAGWIDVGVDVIKDGMNRYGIETPLFNPSPKSPSTSGYLTFQGLSIDDDGSQRLFDATLSFRQACRAAISYLGRFGYTREQAYMLLACAPVESRISCVCNRPNACCTVAIPKDIFDFDIDPSAANINQEAVGRGAEH